MSGTWRFPSNSNGREDGINDAGIETFRKNSLASLAREICQNSCDAHDSDSKTPVVVHFQLEELAVSDFPGAQEFRDVLARCASYTRSVDNAREFFAGARKLLERKKIRMLRISDYNTTGLRGDPTSRSSDWFKLTKAVGVSEKRDGAGGSFGLGKHAPFACSDLRTVIYSTLNNSGKRAFQGVAKLVTHEGLDDEGTTQGTGYFGEASQLHPVTASRQIPQIFGRDKQGTDVCILGFIGNEGEWEDQVAKSIVENFLVAIHEGRFSAKVGERLLINKSSIGRLVRRYASSDPKWNTPAYYAALTSEQARKIGPYDVQGHGTVQLSLVMDNAYPKKVSMFRTGMLIRERGFHTPVRFAGVLIVQPKSALDDLLRSLEPPAHDDWEMSRGSDVARSALRALTSWVGDQVRTLTSPEERDEEDAEHMNDFLPDEHDEPLADTDPTASGGGGKSGKVSDSQRRHASDEPVIVHTRIYKSDMGTSAGSEAHNDDDDDESTPDRPDKPEVPTTERIDLTNIRAYCVDPDSGRYRVLFEPRISRSGVVRLTIVGEDRQDAAPIESASLDGTLLPHVSTGVVGPINFREGRRLAMDVVLRGGLRCALGVSAYAD